MLYMYCLGMPLSDTGESTVMCGGDRLQVTAMVHHNEAQQQPSRKILNFSRSWGTIFWNDSFLGLAFNPEDRDSMFLHSISKLLPDYTGPHTRR
jgi:hypothetical protein